MPQQSKISLEKRIELLEKRVQIYRKQNSKILLKLSNIIALRKHYLKHRAGVAIKNTQDRIKKEEDMYRKIRSLYEKSGIKRLYFCRTANGKTKEKRHIFLCTGNQAHKLRQFAEFNLSHFQHLNYYLKKKRKV